MDTLGLSAKLHWRQTRTAFYHDQQRFYAFVEIPASTCSGSRQSRGGSASASVCTSCAPATELNGGWLDQIPAKAWLIESVGEEAYHAIGTPVKVKFGDYHDRISAAWIGHRIGRVARSRRSLFERESFGYLEHGTATLVDPLVDWLRVQPNAVLRTGVKVEPLVVRDGRVSEVRVEGTAIPCDAVTRQSRFPLLIASSQGRATPISPKFDRSSTSESSACC